MGRRRQLRGTGEAGFSLIEMIVVMILLLIVGAIVSRVMVDSFGFESQAKGARKAQGESAKAIDLLTSDLRSARAPIREDLMPLDFRNGILANQWPSDPAVNTLAYMDLRYATSTRLAFLANVITPPVDRGIPVPGHMPVNTECVVYEATQNGLTRTVRSYNPRGDTIGATGCTGALLQTDVLVRPTTTIAGVPNVFTYTRMWNPGAQPNRVDPTNCRRDAQPQRLNESGMSMELRRVVTVHMDLRSYQVGAAQGLTGEQSVKGAIDVRSRLSKDYLYALGCAY